MAVTIKYAFLAFCGHFPRVCWLVTACGRGPSDTGASEQWSDTGDPGSRPSALLISAHQTPRAERNYGVFDQYLTKNKKLRSVAKFFVLDFKRCCLYLKVCNAGVSLWKWCVAKLHSVSEEGVWSVMSRGELFEELQIWSEMIHRHRLPAKLS